MKIRKSVLSFILAFVKSGSLDLAKFLLFLVFIPPALPTLLISSTLLALGSIFAKEPLVDKVVSNIVFSIEVSNKAILLKLLMK